MNDSRLPEVIYYAACSLDGFIATEAGGVEWLLPFQESGDDHGFSEFYGSIDGLVMGSHTYEASLDLGPWPAPDKPSWVFTRRDLPIAHPTVSLTTQDPTELMESLASEGMNRVWLMGGGKLAASFRERGLISKYMIGLVPVLLGAGIPLLADGHGLDSLKIVDTRTFSSGILMASYVGASTARTGQ
jgi:dihydrofolate reductase